MFTPVKLGNTTLPPEVLKADKKSCKRYGPCGVGEQALYLNSFFIDRRYYVALESVRRVFKRVAMSKGGFTGKGAFGSIPYLVVELDDGSQKQCNFKHEEDVDLLLAHMARVCPDIPRHSSHLLTFLYLVSVLDRERNRDIRIQQGKHPLKNPKTGNNSVLLTDQINLPHLLLWHHGIRTDIFTCDILLKRLHNQFVRH